MAPHTPRARRAPAKPWRASITGRWLKSHYLVGPRGGLAEASHRVSGQPRVDLVQAQVDLAVGEREEAAPRAVALDEERAQPLDLEQPHRLRDAELGEPVHLAHAADALAVGGPHALADGGQVDGAVRHEPLAIRELGQPGLADDDLRPRALEPATHRLAEAERRRRRHRLHRVAAVGADGGRRRAVE